MSSKMKIGTEDRPRVVLFKHNRSLIVQAIDDVKRITLEYESTEKNLKDKKKRTSCKNLLKAKKMGEIFADKLKKKKIKKKIFNKKNYTYKKKMKIFFKKMSKKIII